MALDVVPRDSWSPQSSGSGKVLEIPARYVFTVFTMKQPCATLESCGEKLQYLQGIHTKIYGEHDIRYNFMIGNDGRIYEGRGWTYSPWIVKSFARVKRNSLCISFIGNFKHDMSVIIVPRKWRPDSKPPKWTKFVNLPVENLFIGCTRRASCHDMITCYQEISTLEKIHQNCSYITMADLRYNFLIGGDGRIYEGRGWYNRPSLPTRHGRINNKSLYIAYIGLFEGWMIAWGGAYQTTM